MSLIKRSIMLHQLNDYDRYQLDDGTFSFRVNKQLKADFEYLCRREHLSVASALKRYMMKSVLASQLK